MFSALLLPLLIGGPAAQPAVAPPDDPPIRLWINNDGRFLPGDRAKVQVRTKDDGYLLVFHVDPEGHLRVLFPLDPGLDNFVRGGKKYEIRGRGDRESFEIDNTTGKGTVYAAVSRDPIRFDGFVLGDHWDYRALAPSRLSDNPEQELNELVRRMAQSDFDYDLINYYASDRLAYRSDYSPYYNGSVYSDPWCYSYSCSSYYGSPFNVSIGLFFGRPYRRYYYDPYFYAYDPFYNPFFYDPYSYAPVYRPRYVYPYSRFYGYGGYYSNPYYYDRYRSYRQPYTPYRFRGADGSLAGFRDRGGPTHWINTVYNPPVSHVRETPVATPGRRLSPLADAPGSRRADGDLQHLERHTVEAHRSGGTTGRADGSRQNESQPVRREIDGPRSETRGERRDVPQPPAREARPAPQPERAPVREARPERREVERPSAPPQERGGGRGSSDEGRRRR
jgi:uncharacterized protein DUF4384